MSFLLSCKNRGLLDGDACAKLSIFADLIEQWNPSINLTALRRRDEIEEILLGEPVLAASMLQLFGKSILDFGSGAGIPGLVWAICEPSCRVTSVEVRRKKVSFQKEVVRSCKLSAEIVTGLFPEAVQGRNFDYVVSRAIRFSPLLWKAAGGMLAPGGMLVRFVRKGALEEGWQEIPLNERSSLLIRHAE